MPIPFSVPSLALPGKVAIITGGGTGMGRSMALEFSLESWTAAGTWGARSGGASLDLAQIASGTPSSSSARG